jgi:hypothetical protein
LSVTNSNAMWMMLLKRILLPGISIHCTCRDGTSSTYRAAAAAAAAAAAGNQPFIHEATIHLCQMPIACHSLWQLPLATAFGNSFTALKLYKQCLLLSTPH